MNRDITLITMGAGNVKVLRKTLESFSGVVNEIIYGDMLLFEDDREIVDSYRKDFNIKVVRRPFNHLYNVGFANLLNELSFFASNKMVMYMNTSEVIDEDYGINKLVTDNQDCNSFFFIHKTDPHRWYRVYDRTELSWSGRIHEQLGGDYRPYHKPIFMMKDLEKDMDDPFKAKCFDICKEIVYFQNYISIIDNPETLGETDPGWVKFATDCYDSFKQRLLEKGGAYVAYENGDFNLLMSSLERLRNISQSFNSHTGIEYQNDKKFLL